jgi:predicted nucleotidyltransferase
MERHQALAILEKHRDELRQFGVKSLALFGSMVRGEGGPESDIDILVEFSRPVGLFAFLRLQYRLAELLGRQVDLVTPQALKPQLRDRILQEASHAAQGLEV